ncbi:MAG: hypothetical protein JW776_04050 [Candidatus Lokiarchaeota archaeon]|nr:hypothetical protein [Candidatus Lokiarchaeota archaeon]
MRYYPSIYLKAYREGLATIGFLMLFKMTDQYLSGGYVAFSGDSFITNSLGIENGTSQSRKFAGFYDHVC